MRTKKEKKSARKFTNIQSLCVAACLITGGKTHLSEDGVLSGIEVEGGNSLMTGGG